MDMAVFLQKEGIFPGVHKIGAAISGPRIADKNFTDTRIFLKNFREVLGTIPFLVSPLCLLPSDAIILVDVSDIFTFFWCGRGRGSRRGARHCEGGGSFFIESPQGGVLPGGGTGGGEGREGVCREVGGGGC